MAPKPIRLASGELVEVSEWLDTTREFDLVVSGRRGSTAHERFTLDATEQLLVTAVEASVGRPVEKHELQSCHLQLDASDRPVFEIALAHIVVHDAVLEARVRRMEQLVDAILSTEMDIEAVDPIERRMAQRRATLQRLGYKPGAVLDHRVLVKPLHWRGCEQGAVRVRLDADISGGDLSVRVTLRGVRKRPTY